MKGRSVALGDLRFVGISETVPISTITLFFVGEDVAVSVLMTLDIVM